jgi:predicted nucleic acid-binding protein
MIYLLDTDTCIRYINGRSPKIRAKLPMLLRLDVGVSIITKAEFVLWLGKESNAGALPAEAA